MASFAIYGMRRSGNHAILEWMIKNLSGKDERHVIKHSFITNGNSCYLNAINEYGQSSSLYIDYHFAKSTYKNLIISYEDVSDRYITDYSRSLQKVVVLRDIINVAASRYQKILSGDPKFRCLGMNKLFFQNWIDHASSAERGVKIIKFEDWVSSKPKRDEIAKEFNCTNIDNMKTISHHGGGSSFSGTKNIPSPIDLSTRWKQVTLPKEILEIINSPIISKLRAHHGYEKIQL
tara:strand:- start:38 stop:739 length:702 start_codon:yes stop_codon:yes gene_type:complete